MSRLKERKKFLFVLNPIAGGKKKLDVPALIQKFCDDNFIEHDIYNTTGIEDSSKIQELINRETYHAVVAIGGDGTINLVGNILVNTGLPIGILPLGSANGLARDLNIPLDIQQALEVIAKFSPKYIDTLKINGYNAFHLSDLGFNARIVHRFAQSILRGKLLYVWYGIWEFLKFKPFHYKIKTPVCTYRGKAFMMIITNANKFGTNVSINPLGDIRDGYFEISILKPFPKRSFLHILTYLLKDSIHKSKYYKVIRCKEALIWNKDNESFHIDGEPWLPVKRLDVKIQPKGLRILLP